ncbi:MAG TPA: PilZ domain-containing protein [Deltaproteobacteria bacterium]|nr:PilZ domain-containing protein [Deltaproteobacteria bacterium]
MPFKKANNATSTGMKPERRRSERKALDDSVLLMVLTGESDVLERASVLDISSGGICLGKVEPVKGYAQDKTRIAPDQPVMAYFKHHPLTLYGTVSRIDNASSRLALRVKRSNNEELWEELCQGAK